MLYGKHIFLCTFKNNLRSLVLSVRIYQAVQGYNDSLNVAFIRSFSQDNNKTVYKLLLFADMNESVGPTYDRSSQKLQKPPTLDDGEAIK